jgi:hypothetical protein
LTHRNGVPGVAAFGEFSQVIRHGSIHVT